MKFIGSEAQRETAPRWRALVLGLCLGLPLSGSAAADDSVHFAMSNRIGLIEYCRSKGHLTDAVAARATAWVTVARSALAAPQSPEASAKREEAGRQGKWGSRGMAAERMAETFGKSMAQYCAEQAE